MITLNPAINPDGWRSRIVDDKAMLDVLDELFEYMDARADCDGDSQGFYPNVEATFSRDLRELLIANGRRP